MHGPKRKQQEYRLKQRRRIEASPLMTNKFTLLHGLKVTLEYFDAKGITKSGEMKCRQNVTHMRSAVWFACPGLECTEGDFDLGQAMANAVAGRRTMVTGEIRCQGKRKRGDQDLMPCPALLRYKLNLDYD